MPGLLCLIVLLSSWTVNAEEQKAKVEKQNYWKKLYKAAEECYNIKDLKMDLISRKDREQMRMDRIQLIFLGAGVIKEIETAKRRLDVINSQLDRLGSSLNQDGSDGIMKIFNIRKEIAENEAQIEVEEKKLEGIIKVCSQK